MAFADFLARHNVPSTRAAYMATVPTGREALAGVAQVIEIGLVTGLVGALEQRYGEEKTTLFMSDQTDNSGAPIKDDKGNTLKKSGTGMPASAAGAIGFAFLAAILPLKLWQRHTLLNVASGSAAAWSYRKGIEVGQRWLDSKQPGDTKPKTEAPEPPFAQSAFAKSEIANVKGEMGEGNVYSLVDEANKILAARQAEKAASGR
jgi:hypothetical protein